MIVFSVAVTYATVNTLGVLVGRATLACHRHNNTVNNHSPEPMTFRQKLPTSCS